MAEGVTDYAYGWWISSLKCQRACNHSRRTYLFVCPPIEFILFGNVLTTVCRGCSRKFQRIVSFSLSPRERGRKEDFAIIYLWELSLIVFTWEKTQEQDEDKNRTSNTRNHVVSRPDLVAYVVFRYIFTRPYSHLCIQEPFAKTLVHNKWAQFKLLGLQNFGN